MPKATDSFRYALLAAMATIACGGGSVAANSDPPAVNAGAGIKIDPATETISVDPSVVPMSANCAAGQIVQRTADGWSCVGTAPNSAKLNGHADTDFLLVSGTAANSTQLGGQPASFYLPATGTAANAAQLGGVVPAKYTRNDLASVQQGSLTIKNFNDPGTVIVGGGNTGVYGSNAAGNLHLDADPGKADGRVYLNWFSGRGVRFGSGQNTQVAEIDAGGHLTATTVSTSGAISSGGDVSAASFNGLQIFLTPPTPAAPNLSCGNICVNNGGSCLAMRASPNAVQYGPGQCTDVLTPGFTLKCYCAKF
jgi:hypothetical protein